MLHPSLRSYGQLPPLGTSVTPCIGRFLRNARSANVANARCGAAGARTPIQLRRLPEKTPNRGRTGRSFTTTSIFLGFSWDIRVIFVQVNTLTVHLVAEATEGESAPATESSTVEQENRGVFGRRHSTRGPARGVQRWLVEAEHTLAGVIVGLVREGGCACWLVLLVVSLLESSL